MTTVELTVSGMHCASCAALIEEVLTEQRGLLTAHVDLVMNRAEVTFDDTVTELAALQSVIAELGYATSLVRDGASPPIP
jgi:copper chaperone CopZ